MQKLSEAGGQLIRGMSDLGSGDAGKKEEEDAELEMVLSVLLIPLQKRVFERVRKVGSFKLR